MKPRTVVLIGIIILVVYLLSRPMERGSNEYFIKKMSPSVRGTVRDFLIHARLLGYTPVIRDSMRTYEEQEFYKRQDSRNATPGTSSHESGLAIDIDFYKGGNVLSKKTKKNIWMDSGIVDLATEYGFSWGGNFNNYADNNHFYFQLP